MSHFQQYTDRAWGLIRTADRNEQYVSAYFAKNNLPCYLPSIRKVISKRRSVRRIMFPCYLFVAWGNQDIPIMENCYHISHRIQSEINADKDIIEQMEEIYRIEQLSEIGNLSLRKVPINHSRPIKIQSGLLKGMKGRWDNSNGKKQFHVCLNIAGNRYEIAFDRDFMYNSFDSLAV